MTVPVIVICDDEIELVSELAEWFECNGWAVRTAHTVDEALALLTAGGTTCLVTDRWNSSGDELLRQVDAMPRAQRPDLVAMMTGDFDVQDNPRPQGADLVFLKPVDPTSMLEVIAEQLDARGGLAAWHERPAARHKVHA